MPLLGGDPLYIRQISGYGEPICCILLTKTNSQVTILFLNSLKNILLVISHAINSYSTRVITQSKVVILSLKKDIFHYNLHYRYKRFTMRIHFMNIFDLA